MPCHSWIEEPAGRSVDPLVLCREPELGKFAILSHLGDRPEHLVARDPVDFLDHFFSHGCLTLGPATVAGDAKRYPPRR